MDRHVTHPSHMDPDRNRETDGGGPQRYLVTALVMGSGIGFVFALLTRH